MKAESRKNIYLLGMMGAGKSTIGPLLAASLGRSFVDLDALIEAHSGQTIAQLFAEMGEAGFRKLESRLLRKIADQEKLVVALGGGTVLRRQNRRLIQASGINLYLEASLPTLVERNRGHGRRPLLPKACDKHEYRERLQQLLSERQPLYQRLSHITVPADLLSPEELVDVILEKLNDIGEPS